MKNIPIEVLRGIAADAGEHNPSYKRDQEAAYLKIEKRLSEVELTAEATAEIKARLFAQYRHNYTTQFANLEAEIARFA